MGQRIDLFCRLGTRIRNIPTKEMQELSGRARNENSWFTRENVSKAFDGIGYMLQPEQLENWGNSYDFDHGMPRTVGVIMAGNIPMAGFHDLMSVLISGHKLAVKLSSSDTVLMRWLITEIEGLEPKLLGSILFPDLFNAVDAIIATGSDNTARYFEHYFGDKPHVIRKNRTSCAILDGTESVETIHKVGYDMMTYYGLGCRSVSKIFVPENFDMIELMDGLHKHAIIMEHHKYHNNYDYNKSIYLINREPHLDTGYLLFKESTEFVSPISVIYYQYYQSDDHLAALLSDAAGKIQCIVGNHAFCTVAFGHAQSPGINDFADGFNTLSFLEKLGRKVA